MSSQWLKQSTAVAKIVGPILDSAGVEYASAAIGDLSISKNGGTLTALASAAALTYIANGYYTLDMTTGNTDTLGSLQITCNKSTYQMPPKDLMVVPATVYDVMFTNAWTAAGGGGDIARIAGTLQTARDIGASVLLSSGTGAGQVSLSSGVVTSSLTAAAVQSIWDALTSSLTTVGSIGKKLADWAVGTLTSGERTAIANEVEAQIIDDTDSEKVLEAITDKIASVNPDLGGLTVAAIASAVATELADGAAFTALSTQTSVDAIQAKINAMAGATFDTSTDSLEALRNRGDSAWVTAVGFSTLNAAGVRTAIGLASANLDTQLQAITDNIDGVQEATVIRNTACVIKFPMRLTGTNTPATGKSITGYRSLDGATSWSAVTGTFAEIGNGWYNFLADAADTNATEVAYRFTNTDCDDTGMEFFTSAA